MPAVDFNQVAIGAVLALAVVMLSYYAGALSRSGAVAAFILGSVVFGFGGIPLALLLLGFFIPSSALSLLFKKRKASVENNYEKGSRRDGFQVLANGGVAGGMALVHLILPGSPLPWLAAAAALAGASADTWATELGALSRHDPILISNGRRVPKGTSGGISLAGILASLGGAALIATLFFFLPPPGLERIQLVGYFPVIAFSGLIGSLVDSWLGATLQTMYYCPVCRKETEKHPLHGCGTPTYHLRGWKWLNNDWVNLACTLSATVMAILLSFLLKI